jgi:hypothetical protein
MIYKKPIFVILFVLSGAGVYLMRIPEKSFSENSFQPEKAKTKDVHLISVFNNYRQNPELRTGWDFGTIVRNSG